MTTFITQRILCRGRAVLLLLLAVPFSLKSLSEYTFTDFRKDFWDNLYPDCWYWLEQPKDWNEYQYKHWRKRVEDAEKVKGKDRVEVWWDNGRDRPGSKGLKEKPYSKLYRDSWYWTCNIHVAEDYRGRHFVKGFRDDPKVLAHQDTLIFYDPERDWQGARAPGW